MPRYFYIALFVVAGVAAAIVYRTERPAQQREAEFGGVSLRIEYATTDAARERGLAGRGSVPDGYGMFFVFPKAGRYGFWMKDTLVPLDIFWLDDKGQVVSIARDVATSTYPSVFYPAEPARYVLETAAGFARAHDIQKGTPLSLKNFPSVTE
ncbi:DUF192 domain-containing protein [Candidatus Kaiserbacteria bacterium]|nr:DUF192 domain-containing protein [Candidatus Kaiserbacteria bacterium]